MFPWYLCLRVSPFILLCSSVFVTQLSVHRKILPSSFGTCLISCHCPYFRRSPSSQISPSTRTMLISFLQSTCPLLSGLLEMSHFKPGVVMINFRHQQVNNRQLPVFLESIPCLHVHFFSQQIFIDTCSMPGTVLRATNINKSIN